MQDKIIYNKQETKNNKLVQECKNNQENNTKATGNKETRVNKDCYNMLTFIIGIPASRLIFKVFNIERTRSFDPVKEGYRAHPWKLVGLILIFAFYGIVAVAVIRILMNK